MFKTLQATFDVDDDLPARSARVAMLTRVLNGQMYDGLEYAFHDEKSPAGEYIPLRQRRPSVRYNLCKIVVEDSVSLLFSDGHFPQVDVGADENAKAALDRIIKESGLPNVMIDAAMRGSVGSVAIMFRVIKNRVFFKAQPTTFLTPVWSADAPDTLERVVEQYKVKGKQLIEAGYSIDPTDDTSDFWLRTEWDAQAETMMLPVKVKRGETPTFSPDPAKTVTHKLGFVPVVWIKNLPGGDDTDGAATFPPEAIETQIEIDYQLSQAGRGLKYASDPTLLIKEPATGSDGQMVKGAGNAIVVDADGDAKLLEINGTAADAVMNYVRGLRELALENMHGNRANADKVSAAQSGRAMELMNQSLIWLADKLRTSYGEGALLDLLMMIVAAANKMQLVYKDGEKVGKIAAKQIGLRWPAWFAPTASDRQMLGGTLTTMVDGGIMSVETAVKTIAEDYDIVDIPAELALIAKEEEARTAAAQTTVQIKE